jgi:isochorismate hydrolase
MILFFLMQKSYNTKILKEGANIPMNIQEIIQRLNTHDWTPEKEKTGILLIDLQEYFRGIIVPVLDNIKKIIIMARKKNIPLFFTQHGHESAKKSGMLGRWWGDLIIKGSDEAHFLPELNVSPKDVVIPKATYSAFHKTGFEEKLEKHGIQDLVIGGVMTNLCCETAARDAFVRDYRVFFLADGTSTVNEDFHLATLKNLSYGFATLLTCDRLINTLKQ